MSDNDTLGRSGEDNLGLVIDFANKLRTGNISRGEAKRFLQRQNPWPTDIIHAVPFDPVAFLGQGWSIEKEEQDERSLALTEVDLSKVKLKTYLRKGEVSITGEEKLNRAKASGDIRLDARFLMALWNNKKLIPESWKEKTNGNTTYIYFDGTVLGSPGGYPRVLGLCWRDGEWIWDYGWLERGWSSRRPSAVLAAA